MGCGNSKAVYAPNQPSSSTGPDSNSDTVSKKNECILESGFGSNIETIKKQLRSSEYDTVEHYLIAIIKCLSELVKELNTIHNSPDSSPQYIKILTLRFSDKFYINMNYLGLLKPKKAGLLKSQESGGTLIFSGIFSAIPNPITKNTTNIRQVQNTIYKNTAELKNAFNIGIQRLQDALKIFMYLIILLIRSLDSELNKYVSKQYSHNRDTMNKFEEIKKNLLNRLDEIFNTIYNYGDRARIIDNFDKVLNIRRSKRLKNYKLVLSQNKDPKVIDKLINKIKNPKIKNPEDPEDPEDPEVIDKGIKSIIEDINIKQDEAKALLDSTSKAESSGGSISYKHQIKQIRKLLTNKKLTEKQKEQCKRKINKLKLKIAKEQKLNKINKIKDKLKKANTNLKRKKLTDKQKQQLQIKIKNYKNQIKKLSS
jgi:hypothetical protein